MHWPRSRILSKENCLPIWHSVSVELTFAAGFKMRITSNCSRKPIAFDMTSPKACIVNVCSSLVILLLQQKQNLRFYPPPPCLVYRGGKGLFTRTTAGWLKNAAPLLAARPNRPSYEGQHWSLEFFIVQWKEVVEWKRAKACGQGWSVSVCASEMVEVSCGHCGFLLFLQYSICLLL